MSLEAEFREAKGNILLAAIKLERDTRNDVLDAVTPWLQHRDGCDRSPKCACGLNRVLTALREASAYK